MNDIVEIGRLVGDPTRAALLDALLDGRAHTVTELARHVGVATSTASEHLGRLLDSGLLRCDAQGRHRYYRLIDDDAAALIETMYRFEPQRPVRRPSVPADLAFARRCYDHLAGALGVGLTDHLATIGAVEKIDASPELTDIGVRLLTAVGLPVAELKGGQRRPIRPCLDWTERRPHLAGSVPSLLLNHMLENRWLSPRHRSRALQLTDTGRTALDECFGYRHEPPSAEGRGSSAAACADAPLTTASDRRVTHPTA